MDHPSFQQIAWVHAESGECGEQRLAHSGGEAESYYRGPRWAHCLIPAAQLITNVMGEVSACPALIIMKRFPSAVMSKGAIDLWGKAVKSGFTAPTWKL